MRIRITAASQGDLDGIDLSAFGVGMTYDVSTSLATFLVATQSAIVVDPSEPVVIVPQNDARFATFMDRARDVAAESRKAAEPRTPKSAVERAKTRRRRH